MSHITTTLKSSPNPCFCESLVIRISIVQWYLGSVVQHYQNCSQSLHTVYVSKIYSRLIYPDGCEVWSKSLKLPKVQSSFFQQNPCADCSFLVGLTLCHDVNPSEFLWVYLWNEHGVQILFVTAVTDYWGKDRSWTLQENTRKWITDCQTKS